MALQEASCCGSVDSRSRICCSGRQGLKELYEELGQRVKTPVVLKVDNQAAVKQIENEASSASTKHVDLKLRLLRDLRQEGDGQANL